MDLLDGVLRSGDVRAVVWEMEYFVRWTFARFLPGGQLALAFETSQPWNEGGSCGDRAGPGAAARNRVVERSGPGERGSLPARAVRAPWTWPGTLAGCSPGWWTAARAERCSPPRATRPGTPVPSRPDRTFGLQLGFAVPGPWHALEIDEEGRFLRAVDERGFDLFDLEPRRRVRAGGEWETLECWLPRRP